MPVVWHVIQIYAAQGFDRFELLTGYKGQMIKSFVAEASWPSGIEVICVDTGEDTPTGGRVARAASAHPDEAICVTYADGVADIDLNALLGFHRESGSAATVTVIRPELPFGVARLEGDRIVGFAEKPRSDSWVNGGFMVLEPSAHASIGADEVLEQGPLERLAELGTLSAYRHLGFWFCMDTYKDQVALNDLWEDGEPPWRIWT
jgi:glucose-1-phosphate cytidylyltransferase